MDKLLKCPCCFHETLSERGSFEICDECAWEDDGQDDPRADEARGGPNAPYSLSEARENYKKYGTVYPPNSIKKHFFKNKE